MHLTFLGWILENVPIFWVDRLDTTLATTTAAVREDPGKFFARPPITPIQETLLALLMTMEIIHSRGR